MRCFVNGVEHFHSQMDSQQFVANLDAFPVEDAVLMDNDESPDILTHDPEWCVWRALRTPHLVIKHKVISEPKPAEKHVFSHHSQYLPPCFPPQQKNMTLV